MVNTLAAVTQDFLNFCDKYKNCYLYVFRLQSHEKKFEFIKEAGAVGGVGLLFCSSSLHIFGAGVANSIPTRYPGAVLVRPPPTKTKP